MQTFSEETIKNISEANAESEFLLKERLNAFKNFNELSLENSEVFKKYTKHESYDLPEIKIGSAEIEFELPKVADNIGIILLPIAEALGDSNFKTILEKIFNNEDKFSAFTNAFFNSGYFLYIPNNIQLKVPIIFRTKIGTPSFSKNIILGGTNSKFTVLEKIESINNESSIHSIQLDIFAEEGAKIEHVFMQDLNLNTIEFLNRVSHTQKDSNVNFHSVIFGGQRIRARTNINLEKNGAIGKNFEIIFGKESQRFDSLSTVHSKSDFTKGESHSRGLFTGKSKALIKGLVRVESGAKKSDTYLTQHGMLLSKEASADTIPCLEILEEDVLRATHSASVSPIDDDQIFYLTSHGLEESDARKLIIQGFATTLLKNIDLKEIREDISNQLEKKIGEENV